MLRKTIQVLDYSLPHLLRGGAETPHLEDKAAALVRFKATPKSALCFNAKHKHSASRLSTASNPAQQEAVGFAASLPSDK
jgi:hypothetical protein